MAGVHKLIKEVLMFRILLLALLSLLVTGCVSVGGRDRIWGSGHVTVEERDIAPFTAIDVSGIGELLIIPGESEQLTVETDDNLQRVVRSEVRNGTLYLDFDSNITVVRLSRMSFTLTIKELERITLSGAATIRVQNLIGTQLTVDNSGVGSVVVSGAVREQHVILSGAGSYDGAGLASDHATVDLSGVGSVVVKVRQRLDATLSGAGSVEYIGTPEVHTTATGIGTIRQRGL
jgi:Putative auto-transporter adhesin, head GIN domain